MQTIDKNSSESNSYKKHSTDTNTPFTGLPTDKILKDQINIVLKKAEDLRGYSLKELSDYLNIHAPKSRSMVHSKGLPGQIAELLLGATAKSKPMPDFPELGLELKTLPIDIDGNILETTYVCTAPLLAKADKANFEFEQSTVYKKLQTVLWLPIIVLDNNKTSFDNRIIGDAFIWRPSEMQYNLLKTDWLELTEMLLLGQAEQLTSHYGKILQIRPKAANSTAITDSIDSEGNKISTLPRGFYLRTSFTKELYQHNNSKNHSATGQNCVIF